MRQFAVSVLYDLQHGSATLDLCYASAEHHLCCGAAELADRAQHADLVPMESVGVVSVHGKRDDDDILSKKLNPFH